MAIFHMSSWPSASTAGLTWSSSPTETPPLVMIRSLSAAAGAGFAGGVELVGHDAEVAHFAAQAFEQARAARSGWSCRCRPAAAARPAHQFVAGEEHADAHAAIHRQFRQAGRSGQRDVLRGAGLMPAGRISAPRAMSSPARRTFSPQGAARG
jgi:hypothetical protein